MWMCFRCWLPDVKTTTFWCGTLRRMAERIVDRAYKPLRGRFATRSVTPKSLRFLAAWQNVVAATADPYLYRPASGNGAA